MRQREYSGARSVPQVGIDYGLAYEFVMSLIVFQEMEWKIASEYEYEIGAAWYKTVRAKVPSEVQRGLEQFIWQARVGDSTSCYSWGVLLGLAYECDPPKDVPAFMAYLEALEPLDVFLYLLGYYHRGLRHLLPLDVIVQAAEGDPQMQAQYLKTFTGSDPTVEQKLRALFALEPAALKEMLVDLLWSWYDYVFRDMAQQTLPILERDAEAKRKLQAAVPFMQLIETATNGLTYAPEPGLRKIVLVPTVIGRPWNESSEYQDKTIICYPVADEFVARDTTVPPVQLVRLYQALADERRLRILKLLKTRNYTLQEIADEFGVAKSTMYHHLVLLRSAGLVRMRTDEKDYSLRRETLARVSELLSSYLDGPPT
ncbi:MAG: winged helix-turn-helix transcriptional regulator [Ktedonobacteraceae bacterium]|nr:winged helix-turn-helix transcriptional regulator [Ktedonobacteraceae bacterium]